MRVLCDQCGHKVSLVGLVDSEWRRKACKHAGYVRSDEEQRMKIRSEAYLRQLEAAQVRLLMQPGDESLTFAAPSRKPTIPNRLRQTSIRTYLDCPQKYKLTYVDGYEEPGNDATKAGTVMHAILEEWGRTQLSGEPFNLASQEHRLLRYVAPKPVLYWRGKALAQVAIDAVGDRLKVKAVEVPFKVPLGYKDFELTGKIDVITAGNKIVDWKSSGSGWTPGEEHESIQPWAYSLGFKALYGCLPAGFRFVVISDFPDFKVDIRETDRDEAGVEQFREIAIDIAKDIEAERFEPNPAFKWCPSCPYRKHGPSLLCSHFRDGGR